MKIKLKYVNQRWEGIEGWIGNDNAFWVRIDFLLEYFISSNVDLSKKIKEKINDNTLIKNYCELMYCKFMNNTSNGVDFKYEKYFEWQKNNISEVKKAIKLINT